MDSKLLLLIFGFSIVMIVKITECPKKASIDGYNGGIILYSVAVRVTLSIRPTGAVEGPVTGFKCIFVTDDDSKFECPSIIGKARPLQYGFDTRESANAECGAHEDNILAYMNESGKRIAFCASKYDVTDV